MVEHKYLKAFELTMTVICGAVSGYYLASFSPLGILWALSSVLWFAAYFVLVILEINHTHRLEEERRLNELIERIRGDIK